MKRDDLMQHLMLFVSEGVRVPEQAFDIARTIDLNRFKHMPLRAAAVTILRMGLQRRFGFLSIRNSLLDQVALDPVRSQPASSARRVRGRLRLS
jgi:hypothetical protein